MNQMTKILKTKNKNPFKLKLNLTIKSIIQRKSSMMITTILLIKNKKITHFHSKISLIFLLIQTVPF